MSWNQVNVARVIMHFVILICLTTQHNTLKNKSGHTIRIAFSVCQNTLKHAQHFMDPIAKSSHLYISPAASVCANHYMCSSRVFSGISTRL